VQGEVEVVANRTITKPVAEVEVEHLLGPVFLLTLYPQR
jgi:hypothetical protein